MTLGDAILWVSIVVGVWVYAYGAMHDKPTPKPTGYPVEYCPLPAPSTYAPQGLLWVDEHLEQSTWWGDGAIIQSTH